MGIGEDLTFLFDICIQTLDIILIEAILHGSSELWVVSHAKANSNPFTNPKWNWEWERMGIANMGIPWEWE